ncbi:unnamed protein product [Arctogadus glacialis]
MLTGIKALVHGAAQPVSGPGLSKHNESWSWSCFRIAIMAPTRPAGSLRGGSFKEPCVPGAPATTNTSKGCLL